jgi:hypothetical protein
MQSCKKLQKEFQNLWSKGSEAIASLDVMEENEELRVELDSLRAQVRPMEPQHSA